MNTTNDNHYVTPAERIALDADNVPEFFMYFAIAGHQLNHAWIDEILDARAWRIFDAEIHEADRFWDVVSHEDFVILCCKDSRIPGPRAIKFIEMVESLSPGVVARARDGEGNDALALYAFARKDEARRSHRPVQMEVDSCARITENINTIRMQSKGRRK